MTTLSDLQKTIGYEFIDLKILKTALTHKSAGKHNYEKLEFLGDSILSFCISKILFTHFKTLTEGEMSIIRAKVVNKEKLAHIGERFDLDTYIRTDKHQAVSASIRADVVESIIAAVYLDSDMATCYQLIKQYFEPILALIDKENIKDAKSQLQETAHTYKYKAPIYEVINSSGKPHEKIFEVSCSVGKYRASGRSSSKRQAEMLAAKGILEQIEDVVL